MDINPEKADKLKALCDSTINQIVEQVARQFHTSYEGQAFRFGYKTREDTRVFDPQSPNGRLMMATVRDLLDRDIITTTLHRTQG